MRVPRKRRMVERERKFPRLNSETPTFFSKKKHIFKKNEKNKVGRKQKKN